MREADKRRPFVCPIYTEALLPARIRFPLGLVLACVLTAGLPALSKKKNKQEITQILEMPPDPPAAVVVETKRLAFLTTPLLSKGLLSQQTREAARAILRSSAGSQIVKIRAFVFGSGDLRRVPQIVSEVFSAKHLPLPVVSVLLAGGSPLEGAQVSLEATTLAKKEVNPSGLLFLPAEEVSTAGPMQPLLPLAAKGLDQVERKLAGRGEPVRITCFVSAPDELQRVRNLWATRYPESALTVVQTQRAAPRTYVACEVVARANAALAEAFRSERAVLTGLQICYGFGEDDARLAFRRLDKELNQHGAALKDTALLSVYPLSTSIGEQAQRVAGEFTKAPLSRVTFEGLPGMDAGFALEALAPTVLNQ